MLPVKGNTYLVSEDEGEQVRQVLMKGHNPLEFQFIGFEFQFARHCIFA